MNYAESAVLHQMRWVIFPGVPQATVKSILNKETKSPEVLTIKKLCDGLEITLGEFFSTKEFDEPEQEIK